MQAERLLRLYRRLRGIASPARAGVSLGVGVFVGCLPIYGFHLPLCLLICVPFRLDAVLAYLGANISNPFFAPGLLALELQVGSLILHGELVPFDLDQVRQRGFAALVQEVTVGSALVGSSLGCLAGTLAFGIARLRRSESAIDIAIRKTTQRYRSAPLGDRIYVGLKLRFDPVLYELIALGPLGNVLDAGSGRGQLGLALWELGHVSELSGFDLDARKASVALGAARGLARFETQDLRTAALVDADTILLIDVLHYLPLPEQDALLARARARLRPGGMLVVREIDRRGSLGSLFARASERFLAAVGYNRSAASLQFRSARSIAEILTALGLDCAVENAGRGTPFENRLIVGSLPAQTVETESEHH